MPDEKDKIEPTDIKPSVLVPAEDSAIKEPEVKEPEDKEDFVSPGVSGPSKGVLDKIASIFRGTKKDQPDGTPADSTEEVVEEAEEPEVEPEEDEKAEYEEIDPRFIKAAGDYGWNNRRIVDYAESHSDEDILTMVSLMEGMSKKVQPTSDIVDKQQSTDALLDKETLAKYAEAFNVDEETLRGITKTMTGPLAERLNSVSSELESLKGNLGAREAQKELEQVARNTEIANAIFDKSGFSSLGETKNMLKYPDGSYVLNDPTFRERSKVWDVAQMFHAKGGTFDKAVENALQWYKGSSAEKDIKRNIIKDLKKQEERVMPKRTVQGTEVAYDSEEERKAAIINAALAKYGKELPE